MHIWARRGVRTALVTGGLLMLGTGIASAEENVNPDRPASPLDGSVAVPIHIDNNVIGTPAGQLEVPEVSTELVRVALPPVVTGAAAKVPGTPLTANRASADIVMPADVSGNAVGLLGEAEVVNDSHQSAGARRGTVTGGTGGALRGNVVDLDHTAPVQVTGNAVGGLGTARTTNTSVQRASTTGDTSTSGRRGVLSGNVAGAHTATPVQVSGNALAAGGVATADSVATSRGRAGGAVRTDGTHGVGSGNAGIAALALPVELNGNAVGAAARTATIGDAAVDALAGPGRGAYLDSAGDAGVISGNLLQAPVAGPASVECNALSGVAGAEGDCRNTSTVVAGGGNRTTGERALLSGTSGGGAVAMPVEVFSNAGAVGGGAVARQVNTVTARAGGDNHTLGRDGLGSGTVLSPSAGGPVDVFSNAVAGAGTAAAGGRNTSVTRSAGFAGTSGDRSLAGGNTVAAAVAMPAEAFGNAVGGLGAASTAGTAEFKDSAAGGPANSDDDNGLLASNVAQGAVAGPAQLIGNGVGVAGRTDAQGAADNAVRAGGDSIATGTGGTLSGNIAQALVSLPAQGFANNATAGGFGTAAGMVNTSSLAGGRAVSDGTQGVGSGNVLSIPAASAAQVFAESGSVLGESTTAAMGITRGTAGGTTGTGGHHGVASGNVVTGQAMPVVQWFGDTVAGLGGASTALGANDTVVRSGGDIDTTGDHGMISGNLADVPVGVVSGTFGDAVSAIGGRAVSWADNTSSATVGGASTTSGSAASLSGRDATLPVGADMLIYAVPLEVLAEAMAYAVNSDDLRVAETDPWLNLGLDGASSGGLPATGVPRLPVLPAWLGPDGVGLHPSGADRPVGPTGLSSSLFGGLFDRPGGAFPVGLPAVPGDAVDLPGLPDVSGTGDRVAAGWFSFLPGAGGSVVPEVTGLPELPGAVPARASMSPVDSEAASLADTRAKLAALLGENPIG